MSKLKPGHKKIIKYDLRAWFVHHQGMFLPQTSRARRFRSESVNQFRVFLVVNLDPTATPQFTPTISTRSDIAALPCLKISQEHVEGPHGSIQARTVAAICYLTGEVVHVHLISKHIPHSLKPPIALALGQFMFPVLSVSSQKNNFLIYHGGS